MSEPVGERAETLRMLRWLRRSAIAATLVVIGATGLLVWDYLYEQAEAQAVKNAALVQEYVLRLVQTQDAMLAAADEALSQFARDGSYRWQAHVFLRDLASRFDGSLGIAFVRDDGTFLISSLLYPASGTVGDRLYLRETPAEGLFVDRTRIQPLDIDALVVTRRSQAPGAEGGVWASASSIEVLTNFLRQIAVRSGEVSSLVRRDGTILARGVPVDEAAPAGAGAPGPVPVAPTSLGPEQPIMQVIASNDGGVYRARAVSDGRWRLYATERVGALPLYATFGIAFATLWLDWAMAMAAATAVFGSIGASAYVMTRYAERSVRAEAAQAALAFDRRLLAEAEKTAAVKETMLRELNHRVKNSLQMIQALIRLQRNRPQGPDLDEIGARVLAIATIHDLLYQSAGDFEVDFAELLRRIAASPAVVAPESGIEIAVEAEPLVIDAGAATSLALCTVELVTNAAKHAYGGAAGRIDVVLERVDSQAARLVVADRGRGMPQASGRRSGLRVVEELVRQLGGRLELERAGGTRFTIDFPMVAPEDRIAAGLAAS